MVWNSQFVSLLCAGDLNCTVLLVHNHAILNDQISKLNADGYKVPVLGVIFHQGTKEDGWIQLQILPALDAGELLICLHCQPFSDKPPNILVLNHAEPSLFQTDLSQPHPRSSVSHHCLFKLEMWHVYYNTKHYIYKIPSNVWSVKNSILHAK